jgi:hypothetical protein
MMEEGLERTHKIANITNKHTGKCLILLIINNRKDVNYK